MRITGGCHCGAIRYEVNGDLIVHALCHCTDCRRKNPRPRPQSLPPDIFQPRTGRAGLQHS